MRNKFWVVLIWAISLIDFFASAAHAEPLSAAMALLYGSGISAGGSILGGLLGGGDEENAPIITQLPDYAESTGARQDWWSKLQSWGADPNYGAVTPDWADIWTNAQNKVRQYYWGSPTQMGVAGKVKASAARRGVSDSAALDANLTALGAEEAGKISDMSTQIGIQKTNLAESGRQSWLNSLSNLAKVQPQYNVSQPQQTAGIGDMISGVGNAFGSAMAQQNQNDWLAELLKSQLPAKTQSQMLGFDTRIYS